MQDLPHLPDPDGNSTPDETQNPDSTAGERGTRRPLKGPRLLHGDLAGRGECGPFGGGWPDDLWPA